MGLFIGFLIGLFTGVVLMCLAQISKEAERRCNEDERKK